MRNKKIFATVSAALALSFAVPAFATGATPSENPTTCSMKNLNACSYREQLDLAIRAFPDAIQPQDYFAIPSDFNKTKAWENITKNRAALTQYLQWLKERGGDEPNSPEKLIALNVETRPVEIAIEATKTINQNSTDMALGKADLILDFVAKIYQPTKDSIPWRYAIARIVEELTDLMYANDFDPAGNKEEMFKLKNLDEEHMGTYSGYVSKFRPWHLALFQLIYDLKADKVNLVNLKEEIEPVPGKTYYNYFWSKTYFENIPQEYWGKAAEFIRSSGKEIIEHTGKANNYALRAKARNLKNLSFKDVYFKAAYIYGDKYEKEERIIQDAINKASGPQLSDKDLQAAIKQIEKDYYDSYKESVKKEMLKSIKHGLSKSGYFKNAINLVNNHTNPKTRMMFIRYSAPLLAAIEDNMSEAKKLNENSSYEDVLKAFWQAGRNTHTDEDVFFVILSGLSIAAADTAKYLDEYNVPPVSTMPAAKVGKDIDDIRKRMSRFDKAKVDFSKGLSVGLEKYNSIGAYSPLVSADKETFSDDYLYETTKGIKFSTIVEDERNKGCNFYGECEFEALDAFFINNFNKLEKPLIKAVETKKHEAEPLIAKAQKIAERDKEVAGEIEKAKTAIDEAFIPDQVSRIVDTLTKVVDKSKIDKEEETPANPTPAPKPVKEPANPTPAPKPVKEPAKPSVSVPSVKPLLPKDKEVAVSEEKEENAKPAPTVSPATDAPSINHAKETKPVDPKDPVKPVQKEMPATGAHGVIVGLLGSVASLIAGVALLLVRRREA